MRRLAFAAALAALSFSAQAQTVGTVEESPTRVTVKGVTATGDSGVFTLRGLYVVRCSGVWDGANVDLEVYDPAAEGWTDVDVLSLVDMTADVQWPTIEGGGFTFRLEVESAGVSTVVHCVFGQSRT